MPDTAHRLTRAAYLTAVVFGAFWGTWGAAVPQVRDDAGLSDGQLGTALLFVSAGALPAMLLTGRALDRWGLRGTAYLLVVLGATGLAATATADGLVALSIGLACVGAASGAVDVAMHAAGGRAEQRSARPVIARLSAIFSSTVVLASLGTGAAYALGAPTWGPFAAVLLVSLAAAVATYRLLPLGVGGTAPPTRRPGVAGVRLPMLPLVLVGALAATALAAENAHQSWGAVFLEDVLDTGAGWSAVAPAVFAASVAITRVAVSRIDPVHARTVLVVGSLVAAAGAAVIARAPSLPVALAGLVLAAAGTAPQFPTLMSIVSRNVAEATRGRATSIVATVSYLGFLLGPVYVGLWASGTGLRGAMLAIAALGLVLAALTVPLLALSRYPVGGAVRPSHEDDGASPATGLDGVTVHGREGGA